MLALGISPGDEVIVPTLTYIASANSITYTGATPIFADSDPNTWQINPSSIEEKITDKTRAIIVVHLYGHACEMDSIKRIADSKGIFLIEDCAEAIGTKYKGDHVGAHGDISTFSFFGNKTITTGEGGMVCTNDKTLMDRVKRIKGQGLAEHREYWHDIIGYNYRMTNIQAAIGLAQLEQMDATVNTKRALSEKYKDKLKGLPLAFHEEAEWTSHSYWMVSILVDDISLRDELRQNLRENGIETRPLFFPIHTMPMYSRSYQKLPIAESLSWRGINLPSWPGLSDEQIAYICDCIKDYFKNQE